MTSTALFGRSNQFLGLELHTRFARMIASGQRYIENERGICGNTITTVDARSERGRHGDLPSVAFVHVHQSGSEPHTPLTIAHFLWCIARGAECLGLPGLHKNLSFCVGGRRNKTPLQVHHRRVGVKRSYGSRARLEHFHHHKVGGLIATCRQRPRMKHFDVGIGGRRCQRLLIGLCEISFIARLLIRKLFYRIIVLLASR